MLQQTQVATVIPYFERWMARFPSVEALASASEDEVLSVWQGLGYYQRGRLVHKAAKQLAANGFPKDFAGWQAIPGVGEYTAAAIASIAYGEAVGVVDGNVKRVYARLFESSLIGTGLHKAAKQWADSAIVRERPGDWNQAVMELGATICRPVKPRCNVCPVSHQCGAFQHGTQDLYPVAVAKKPPTQLEEEIAIIRFQGKIALTDKHSRGWWKGLKLLPNDGPTQQGQKLGEIAYKVTTHRIRATVMLYDIEEQELEYEWASSGELDAHAIPAPHRRALKLLTESEQQLNLY